VAGATDVINEHYGFALRQHDVTLRDAATLCN
jgi:hypothetical protein